MDLLLSRYSNLEFILQLDISTGIKLIQKAFENRSDELLQQRWVLGGYDREIGFDEFKGQLTVHRTNTTKTDEEILLEVKDILDTFNTKVVE